MSLPYRYRAAHPDGQLVEGIVQAESPRDALDLLRRQTLVPVSVEPARPASGRRWGTPRQADALASSLRMLATLIGAGLSLDRSLDFAAANAGRDDLAGAWRGVLRDVRGGASFSDAVQRQPIFSAFTAAVLRAGEEGGSMDEALADWPGTMSGAASWRRRSGRPCCTRC